jgi:hypothetical protein
MQADQLYRNLLYRHALRKQVNRYTEFEINVLIGIYVMNTQFRRCSGNMLFKYLSEIHRMPYKKNLLATIRKFKSDDMIRVIGNGAGTNIRLTEYGRQYLFELEEKLKGIKVSIF